MSKITLSNLVNLQNETTAVGVINANSAVLTTALDNTLSRDGTSPNTMGAALDMNSNQIFNLPAPSSQNSPARLIDVVSNPTIVIPGTGTSGHVVGFLDTNLIFSGTNTFSAALKYGGVTLSNAVTGTGNMVLSAGPTLTGTLAGANATLSGTLAVTGTTNLGFTVLSNSMQILFTNGNIELGSLSTPNTPFLDFHSSGNSIDYDSRLMASGGSGVTGNGTLTFLGNFFVTSAILNLTNASTSTSTTTGGVVVTGGLGVGGDAFFGGIVNAAGRITSISPVAGVGYATGAGGTVTQITSRATGVTLNKTSGDITMFTTNGSAAASAFVVSNNTVAVTDTIVLSVRSATNGYNMYVTNVTSGTFTITFQTNGGTASDTPIIHFNVIKGVSA